MATLLKAHSPAPAPKALTLSQNGIAGGLFLRIPAEARTLAGFRAWRGADEVPEKLRAMYLQGEILLDMTWEDLTTHNVVKTEVTRVLASLDLENEQGTFYSEGAFVANKEADVGNNPDGVYVRWESLDVGRVRLVERAAKDGRFTEIEGSPDWVMEVVSDSSVKKDTVDLRRAYHRAGIREYWLIDVRGEEIAFQILQHRKKGYVAAARKEGWQHSVVFGRAFRLVRKRHPRGGWIYRLEVMPT